MACSQFVIFGLLGIISAASAGKLPPVFDICHKTQPKFNQCLEKAVEKAVVSLVPGYAPLGIFSVDPLEITAIDIDQGHGPVSINLKFKNLKISGFKDVKVKNVKSDLKKYIFTGDITIPKVVLKGKYSIDGKVLILPITGNGDAVLTLDNVVADIELVGKEFKKDGVTYMKASKFGFNFETKKLGIKLDNLFNGDKALGPNMNKFLNENWAEILKELKPAIQQTFGMAFADISNRIFSKVPYDEIFPN